MKDVTVETFHEIGMEACAASIIDPEGFNRGIRERYPVIMDAAHKGMLAKLLRLRVPLECAPGLLNACEQIVILTLMGLEAEEQKESETPRK